MVTKLTREQYQQIYGVQAPTAQPVEELNTTPTTVQMTKAEYNAKYRPKELSYFADAAQDIKETGQALGDTVNRAVEKTSQTKKLEDTGQISGVKGAFQRFGTSIGMLSGFLGDVVVGTGKVVLPENKGGIFSEQGLRDFASTAVGNFSEYNQDFIESLRNSESELDRKTAAKIDEVIHLYKTDDVFRSDVQAAGDLFMGLVDALGFGPASKAATKVNKTALELAEEGAKKVKTDADRLFKISDDAKIKKAALEIQSIEEKYVAGRKLNDYTKDGGVASRERIVKSGVLDGAVDEDGLIRTKQEGGAADQYKKLTIDDTEDIVKRILIKENQKINLNEVKSALKTEIFDSGLEGASLVKAIKSIDTEIQGFAQRADEFGDVLLAKLQDFKISATRDINYLADNNSTVRLKKAKAAAYRKLIEEKSSAPIKDINKKLSEYYEDIKRIEALDGRRVKGGRLGKYTSQVGGQLVGGFTGSAGGPLGAGIGAYIGGEAATALQGKAFKRTFGRVTKEGVEESPILNQAKRFADEQVNLRVPDKPVGIPQGLPQTAETRLLEKQIKKNVTAQKAAIKAGDFELVATLKDIYNALVTRLKNYVRDYVDNIDDNVGLGLSINKTVSPEKVAKMIDSEDFAKIERFLSDPLTEQIDPDMQTMFKEMGIGKADLDVQVSFLKEVKNEAIQNGELLDVQPRDLYRQDKNITNNTIPSDSIDSTVAQTEKTATTKTTDLLEEARKYDSADEFRKAYTANSLMDLSDPQKHRWGRIFEDGVDEETGRYMDAKYTADLYGSRGNDQYRYEKSANVPDVSSPDEMVTIYRGTVSNQNEMMPGDFVSFSKEYALMHNDGEKLLTLKVPAKDVVWQGNDLHEWIYSPESIRGKTYDGGLEKIWKEANN